jgi:TRAP-type transport system periplasmic protein
MRNRWKVAPVLLAGISLLVIMFLQPTSGFPQTVLKFASPLPEKSIYAAGPTAFMKKIEERTQGRIKFQTFWGGTLVKPPEVVDSCGKGVADLVHGLWIYDPGKLPLGNYDYNFFFNEPNLRTQSKIKREMFAVIPALNDELAKYNIAPALQFMAVSSYDFLSRVPIRSLEDFKGKKVAHTPVEHVPAYESIGGASVITPAGPVYSMLERGLVEIAAYPTEVFNMFKMQEVAKHLTTGGFSMAVSVSLWMNMDKWKTLTEKDRELFIEVGKEADEVHVQELVRHLDQAMETFKNAGGTVYTLSEADKKKWMAAMPDLPTDWAKKMEAKGLPGRQIVEKYIELSAKYGWTILRK